MIYKVVGNFNQENFEKIIKRVSERFGFMYYNETLYLSVKDYDSMEGHKDVLSKAFRPSKDFLIREITSENILKEPEIISEWCRNNFVSLEQQKYEKEQQAKLQEVWKAMDKMEKELQIMLKENYEKNKA